MYDPRFGRLLRAERRRRGMRQIDVEAASGVDQTTISLIERGMVAGLTVARIRRAAASLGIGVELHARGAPLTLVDAKHASHAEMLLAILRRQGWATLAEYTFNHYGERGSLDVVAWHPDHRALLIVEVKTRIVDVQELLATFDRKCRIVPRLLATERGWRPTVIGRLLLVADGATQRRIVAAHEHTFSAAFPDRSRRARQWLRYPSGPLAALWFLSPTNPGRGNRLRFGSERVRHPAPRSETRSGAT